MPELYWTSVAVAFVAGLFVGYRFSLWRIKKLLLELKTTVNRLWPPEPPTDS